VDAFDRFNGIAAAYARNACPRPARGTAVLTPLGRAYIAARRLGALVAELDPMDRLDILNAASAEALRLMAEGRQTA
jgi:hypothetical protein